MLQECEVGGGTGLFSRETELFLAGVGDEHIQDFCNITRSPSGNISYMLLSFFSCVTSGVTLQMGFQKVLPLR